MDSERKKKLLETMKNINKSQGNIMNFANTSPDAIYTKTDIKCIDNFIGGGIKKGVFTVLWGASGCGKSTLALQTIGAAQKNGEICAYIDMEHSFEKERAIQLGVDVDDLVMIDDCQTAEQAMGVVRTLAKDKVCDLIIVDSIQAMSPKGEQENKGKERDIAEAEMALLAAKLSKFFRIVSPDVFRAKMTCVLIGQCRMSLGSFIVRADLSGGEALKHWSYQTVFMRRGQGADAPSQKVVEYFLDPDGKMHKESSKIPNGFDVVLKLTKTKSSASALEFSEIHVPFIYNKGFVDYIPTDDDKIKITGTDEEKVIIEKKLIEKGILFSSDTQTSSNVSAEEFPQSTDELSNLVKDLEPKKKRGRKPKETK